MRLSHLTDSEIQSYLDREHITPLFRRQVSNHLSGCNSCADEVARYETLYGELSVNETDECADSLANKIMASLPRPAGKELWREALGWVTHVFSLVLFLGILTVPFELSIPAISLPSFSLPTWAAISELSVVNGLMQASKTALSPEHLPAYLFALIGGLIMFNIQRIIVSAQRQRI